MAQLKIGEGIRLTISDKELNQIYTEVFETPEERDVRLTRILNARFKNLDERFGVQQLENVEIYFGKNVNIYLTSWE